jgi:hypothetical protein
MTWTQKDTHCVLLRDVRALASDFEQALHEVCTLFIGRLFLSQLSELVLQRVFMRQSPRSLLVKVVVNRTHEVCTRPFAHDSFLQPQPSDVLSLCPVRSGSRESRRR